MSPRYRIGAIMAVLAVVLLGVGYIVQRDGPPTVRLAVAVSEHSEFDDGFLPAANGWPSVQRVVFDSGVADEHGVKIVLVPRITGRGTIESLLDNNADIAYVATAPLVHAIANGEDVVILALTERSDRQIRLIVRAEHVGDWVDQPIGYVPGTAIQSALTAEIDHTGRGDSLTDGSLDLVGARHPTALMYSLVDGTISSAMLLQPQAALLTGWESPDAQSGYVDLTTPGLHEFDGILVTTRERWSDNRRAILLALEATKATRGLIADDPDNWLRQIHNSEAGHTDLRDTPPWFWDTDEIVFVTDHTEIAAALDREARLQVEDHRLDRVPSFDDALAVLGEVAELR